MWSRPPFPFLVSSGMCIWNHENSQLITTSDGFQKIQPLGAVKPVLICFFSNVIRESMVRCYDHCSAIWATFYCLHSPSFDCQIWELQLYMFFDAVFCFVNVGKTENARTWNLLEMWALSANIMIHMRKTKFWMCKFGNIVGSSGLMFQILVL